MDTRTSFALLVLMSWVITFVVLVVSALKADCFFLHPEKLLVTALVNTVCVVYFISMQIRQAAKGE